MFGDRLDHEDCSQLLDSLAQCDLPFQCAHGRPSSVVLVEDLKALCSRSASMIAASRKKCATHKGSETKISKRPRLKFESLVKRT